MGRSDLVASSGGSATSFGGDSMTHLIRHRQHPLLKPTARSFARAVVVLGANRRSVNNAASAEGDCLPSVRKRVRDQVPADPGGYVDGRQNGVPAAGVDSRDAFGVPRRCLDVSYPDQIELDPRRRPVVL